MGKVENRNAKGTRGNPKFRKSTIEMGRDVDILFDFRVSLFRVSLHSLRFFMVVIIAISSDDSSSKG